MDKKNIIVSAIVALVVVVLGLVFFGRPTERIIEKIIREVEKGTGLDLGAVSGPSIDSETWTVNGVTTHFYRRPMQTGTTTVCQIKLPPASTTISNPAGWSAVITTAATSTAGQLAVYEVDEGWATSTRKAIFGITDIVAAGGRLMGTSTATTSLISTTIGATTTDSTATGLLIRGSTGSPGGDRFILFDYRGGSNPFLGAGFCTAELREL